MVQHLRGEQPVAAPCPLSGSVGTQLTEPMGEFTDLFWLGGWIAC